MIGDGTVVSTGAIVFAGSQIGARCIVGDQSCIRERVELGDDCILGRGSLIENDTTVGAGTRIQAERVRDRVLDARGGRLHRAVRRDDERQLHGPHREAQGADEEARRSGAARASAAARSCAPAIEIGEEAFVGAGAVVTKDVPPRVVVVGSPARVLRDVDPAELRENGG